MADDTTTPETAADEVEVHDHEQDAPDTLGDPGKAALDAERRARREAEKQLRAMSERLKSIEDADKSEAEKAAQRAQEAEQRAQATTERLHKLMKADAIRTAALTAKALDADVVAAMVADQVSITEDDEVEGVTEAIERLRAAKPHLFDARPAGYADGIPKSGKHARTAADIFAAQTSNL